MNAVDLHRYLTDAQTKRHRRQNNTTLLLRRYYIDTTFVVNRHFVDS